MVEKKPLKTGEIRENSLNLAETLVPFYYEIAARTQPIEGGVFLISVEKDIIAKANQTLLNRLGSEEDDRKKFKFINDIIGYGGSLVAYRNNLVPTLGTFNAGHNTLHILFCKPKEKYCPKVNDDFLFWYNFPHGMPHTFNWFTEIEIAGGRIKQAHEISEFYSYFKEDNLRRILNERYSAELTKIKEIMPAIIKDYKAYSEKCVNLIEKLTLKSKSR